MEELKARMIKQIESHMEEYLATHLMSIMQVVKDIYSKLEVT